MALLKKKQPRGEKDSIGKRKYIRFPGVGRKNFGVIRLDFIDEDLGEIANSEEIVLESGPYLVHFSLGCSAKKETREYSYVKELDFDADVSLRDLLYVIQEVGEEASLYENENNPLALMEGYVIATRGGESDVWVAGKNIYVEPRR